MKIRTDFVTNSSSSSFVVWGVSMEDLENVADKIMLEVFNDQKQWFELSDEQIEKMTEVEKIKYAKENGEDFNEYYSRGLIEVGGPEHDLLGISPCSLLKHFPDSQLKDVEKIVAEELNKELGTNFTKKDISYFEEGWYDG